MPVPALRTVDVRVTISPGAASAGAVKASATRSERRTVSGMVKALLSSNCSLTSPFLSATTMRCVVPSAYTLGSWNVAVTA